MSDSGYDDVSRMLDLTGLASFGYRDFRNGERPKLEVVAGRERAAAAAKPADADVQAAAPAPRAPSAAMPEPAAQLPAGALADTFARLSHQPMVDQGTLSLQLQLPAGPAPLNAPEPAPGEAKLSDLFSRLGKA